MNIARQPNIAAMDLNLLRVFDAIMQEGTILRASQRLNMSQPAASHALARLRHALGDDLFVRSTRGMLPTPRAQQLAEPVRSALSLLELGLRAGPFDPSTARQKLAIALDNSSVVALAPHLVRIISEDAPGIELELRPSGTLDVEQLLDVGEVDVAIGRLGESRERFGTQPLFDDDFVAVQGPKAAPAPGPISLASLCSRPHLHLSSTGDDTTFVDSWLAQHDARRTIRHSVPLLGCEAILRMHDVLVIVRRRIAHELCRRPGLALSELPFTSPRVQTYLRWHRRFDRQPTHAWLRDSIQRAARGLLDET